jgi:hypothetical protein
MQPLECRFRFSRAMGEAALVFMMFFFGLLFAGNVPDPRVYLGSLVGGLFVALGGLIAFRWRARFLVYEQGVEFRLSANARPSRLDWSEIDELFLLNDTQFELRGAGRHLRFAGPYEDLYSARQACLPRLERIRETLQTRALREGKVTFGMPGGRWKAHVLYLGAVLILTGVTFYCLATLLHRKVRTGLPFILLFFGGSWLWGLRKRASGLGTRVVLQREGLVVRRLDGKDKIPWEDLERTEWNEHNGLNLVLRSRRVIALPRSLANLGLLEEFLHEGRRAVDSQTRGEAEERTMMQSP